MNWFVTAGSFLLGSGIVVGLVLFWRWFVNLSYKYNLKSDLEKKKREYEMKRRVVYRVNRKYDRREERFVDRENKRKERKNNRRDKRKVRKDNRKIKRKEKRADRKQNREYKREDRLAQRLYRKEKRAARKNSKK